MDKWFPCGQKIIKKESQSARINLPFLANLSKSLFNNKYQALSENHQTWKLLLTQNKSPLRAQQSIWDV